MTDNHYDFKNTRRACSACGWFGLGSEAKIGESFNDGAEYHCPTCDAYFGYIAFPLLSESLSDPRAPAEDKLFFATLALQGAKKEQL